MKSTINTIILSASILVAAGAIAYSLYMSALSNRYHMVTKYDIIDSWEMRTYEVVGTGIPFDKSLRVFKKYKLPMPPE